jgi:uracil-DNA glycosylase family 4
VGLAPGKHGANATGRPFTGDYAGILLYETLYRFGFSNKPVSKHDDDGLQLKGCRITNAVKCLPPDNKPTTQEIRRCNAYLMAELNELPRFPVVLALGTIAHNAVLRAKGLVLSHYRFAHARIHQLEALYLLDSYHCSRYNTQTGRLTKAGFQGIFIKIAGLLSRDS